MTKDVEGDYMGLAWSLPKSILLSFAEWLILEVELHTILEEILLATQLGFSDLWVKTDSTLAINCVTRDAGPWAIWDIPRRIRNLSLNQDSIFRIYRNRNQVVVSLATEGWDHCCFQEYGPPHLSCLIYALIQTHRYGLPNFRGH